MAYAPALTWASVVSHAPGEGSTRRNVVAGHRRGETVTCPEEAIIRALRHGPAPRRAAPWLAGIVVLSAGLQACQSTAPFVVKDCDRADLGGESVARVWDEQALELIRQVVPAPTVHARNLFHLSAAMWDAWAAYDPEADGYFVTEKRLASEVTSARETAISYAAYRILLWRYAQVSDLDVATEQLNATMATLCYSTAFTSADGDSPAALGNRIAAAVIEEGRSDGALEDVR
jgi:hypothetical protein